MQLSDTVTLAAAPDRVFAALTDPAILKACIPGCSELVRKEGHRYELEMSIPTGLRPLKFRTTMRMDVTEAPQALSVLRGQQGRIDITLEERGAQTVLQYSARAEISGRAALLGHRMLSGIARKLAAGFFARLEDRLAATPTVT